MAQRESHENFSRGGCCGDLVKGNEMATINELSQKAAMFKSHGFNVSAVEAGFFAPSIESMFATTRAEHGGQRADVLLLQFTGHEVDETLAVMPVVDLEKLIARVAAADVVLAR